MHARRGFIFLYVLGILSVTLALAFALLRTAQTAHTGATKTEMDTLANRAAKEGVQHAMTVIRQQFSQGPGIPTQLNDRWRTVFWSIDAGKVGISTVAINDDSPTGKEYTPEDFYQNDVPVENGLGEEYMEVDEHRGTYLARTKRYNYGWWNTPGLARWFEPGVQSNNPVSRPLSFHLNHPVVPNAASPDPAVKAGENYAPDLDEPVWYDSEMIATSDPVKRRYRLRYAVAVEDLSGHLLTTVPGEFDTTATSVLSGSPSDVDRYKINEVDNSVADLYAGTMSNMFRYTGYRVWEWGDVGLRGLGATQQSMGYQMGYNEGRILASRNGLGQMTYYDDADQGSLGPYYLPVPGTDSRMNHESVNPGDFPAQYFNVGPFPSFQSLWHDASNVNSNERPYLFTPFGRSPLKVTVVPKAWNESRVNTPWQVNIPTMAPMALTPMLYAYMPREFRMQASDQKDTQNWDNGLKWFPPGGSSDVAATGGPTVPAKYSAVVINVEPFDEMANLAYFDQNGGVVPTDPYPGNNPTAPGSHWLPNLGAQVLTNSVLDIAGCGILKSMASYPTYDFSDYTILSQRFAGGTQETLKAKLVRLGTGNGSGATGTATIGGGSVGSIAVVSQGSGYTDNPIVAISGGGGSGATATAAIDGSGKVVSITVSSGGSGYTSKPTITITPAPAYGPKDYIRGYKYEAGFYYHNSYWLDMCVAMLHAVAVSHYSWLDQVNGANTSDATSGKPKWSAAIPAGYFDPALASDFVPGTLTRDHDTDGNGVLDSPSAFDSIAEIDQQFLRNLGEWPGNYATGTRPVIANGALRMGVSGSLEAIPAVIYEDLNALGSKNIKMMKVAATITLQQASLLELVVNDMRMSFFGASPDYPMFRPLDLDDDGRASCSCYVGGSAPANAADGQGPIPEKWFSLTGCFTLQKSRYYHIFTRGQLFDELRSVPVAQTDVESVYVVDPDGDMWDVSDQPGATPGNGLADSHLLFQRILSNRYLGAGSHVDN